MAGQPKGKLGFNTLSIHAGQKPDGDTLSRGLPIIRTSSFLFKSVQHGADLFALKEPGNIYTRLGNPTMGVLEERVTALEGGVAGIATASGTAAVHYIFATICSAGDEIISASNLYGGTYTMFSAIFPQQFGIKVNFVSVDDIAAFKAAITPKTKAIFVETIGNPALDVVDLEAVVKLAAEADPPIPVVVDSTFTTPYLFKPFEHGAHIIIHSCTKWIGGHGTAIGGVVIDGGTFKWKDNARFPLMNEPDPNYHGLRWAHDLPPQLAPAAFALRYRCVPLRNLGACMAPDNAWFFIQGLETLSLRMARHCENSLAVAQFLAKHPKVAWVRYPGLESDRTHPIAKKYLKKGFGSVVVFGMKSVKAGAQLIEALQLFSNLANVGDAKSLALHPATTSHSQMSVEEQEAAGLKPELVRLSIGLEDIEDILADLSQAFDKVTE